MKVGKEASFDHHIYISGYSIYTKISVSVALIFKAVYLMEEKQSSLLFSAVLPCLTHLADGVRC